MQGERVMSGNFDRLLWPPQRRGRGASRVRSVDMPTADLGGSREQGEWQVGTPLNRRRGPHTMEVSGQLMRLNSQLIAIFEHM